SRKELMPGAAEYRTEHIAETPRGWRVRMKAPGVSSQHLVAIAFPPGRRKKGSGRLVEILHPAGERNPKCEVSEKAKKNPGELLIFGNPAGKKATRERAARIRGARLNPKAFAGWKRFTQKEKNFLRSIHAPAPRNEEEVRAYKEVLRKINEINAQ